MGTRQGEEQEAGGECCGHRACRPGPQGGKALGPARRLVKAAAECSPCVRALELDVGLL